MYASYMQASGSRIIVVCIIHTCIKIKDHRCMHHTPEHSEIHFSTLETRSRISSFQSHASRRDREFLPVSLMLRDEIENFFPSVSCFETRSRISVFRSRASRRDRDPVGSFWKYSQTRLWCLLEVVGSMDSCHRLISIAKI